ncbi:putative membrane protein [Paenibacillus sp. LBL]|nr:MULTISPECIES: hypothetical protein [Paenibacillus]MDH6673639.1 putative membrane protein [Paenibacillus sp. LBL]
MKQDLAVIDSGGIFGFTITPEQYDGVVGAVNAVLGVLVVLGIVSNPADGSGYMDSEKE